MALWLPRLPTDRPQRKKSSATRGDVPLVIAIKADNAMRIHALDRKAEKLGLHIGQPLANARAMIGTLDVVDADLAADARLLNRIADWCDRFTPFVALDAPDGLNLDVTGVTHLFGGERAMLGAVTSAIEKQGFAVSAGIAGTAVAARALSRYTPGTIAEPRGEREAVSGLPVSALNCASEITHALKRAGLKTIAQVAGRQRAELASRFGKEFVSTLERALGQNESPISPRIPLPDYAAEHRFADPVTAQTVIAETLTTLSASVGQILEQRGQGARKLEAVFFRADGTVRRIGIETGAPARDPAVIARLFRLKLDALTDPLDPGFGFDLIRLEATLSQRSSAQSIGFDDPTNAEKEIAQLIDALSTRFGGHRVLRFVPQDTHIPEAAGIAVPAQEAMAQGRNWQRKRAAFKGPRRPLLMLEKPEPVEVVAEVPDGPPLRFRWRRMLHSAVFADGPERIEMEWWRHRMAMPARDYFRLQDSEGRRFWLYREGFYGQTARDPRWFVHGLFA